MARVKPCSRASIGHPQEVFGDSRCKRHPNSVVAATTIACKSSTKAVARSRRGSRDSEHARPSSIFLSSPSGSSGQILFGRPSLREIPSAPSSPSKSRRSPSSAALAATLGSPSKVRRRRLSSSDLDREFEEVLQSGFVQDDCFLSDVPGCITERASSSSCDSAVPPISEIITQRGSFSSRRARHRDSCRLSDKENNGISPRFRKMLEEERDDARLVCKYATASAELERGNSSSNPASFSLNASRLQGKLKSLEASLQRTLVTPM